MDTAKVFMSGRSQAVRLPKEYRFDTDEVIIRRTPEGILLVPKPAKNLGDALMEAFAEIDARYPEEVGDIDFERPEQGEYEEREPWWEEEPALAMQEPRPAYGVQPAEPAQPGAVTARKPRQSKPR